MTIGKSNVDVIHVGQAKVLSTWLQKELFSRISVPVVSDEGLAGDVLNWRTGVLSRDALIHGLHCLYPNAKIIVCIRENRSWVESLYSQYIKQGGFKRYPVWFRDDFDQRYLDTYEYIRLIRSLFSEVFVLWYEEFRRDKPGVVKRLCDFIGVPVPEGVCYDKVYNRRWKGLRLRLGWVRGVLFKVSRILLEVDKNG